MGEVPSMRDTRIVQYGHFYTFLTDKGRVNLFMDAWDYMDIRKDYVVRSRIEHVSGFAVMDYDDPSAECEVFETRGEATLDQFGEDDPREVR